MVAEGRGGGGVSAFWISLLSLVVFFAAIGALHSISVYRCVLRELNNPRKVRWGWIDVPGLLLLALIPGVLRFFAPRSVERHTIIFIVVFLMADGAISEGQAKYYLHLKGIEGAL